MRAMHANSARVVTAALLTFAFVTSACGALTGLDQDFHEVDCFRDAACADGATDATLTEGATTPDGGSDQNVLPGTDGSRSTDGTLEEHAADAGVDKTNVGTDVGADAANVEASDAGPDRPVTGDSGQDTDTGTPDTGVDATVDAGVCGNGFLDPAEQCDQGAANIPVASAYGMKGACTTLCTFAPYCGDGVVNGPEVCDDGGSGSTALGACNPECTGYYTKKVINQTTTAYNGNLGAPSGADNICLTQFGAGYKALLVGGSRRATVTPYVGDSPQDWVLQKYTYYYNAQNQLIWRTDSVSLLGVSDGGAQAINAPVFDAGASLTYAWSGWNMDWTTVQDIPANAIGTCSGWTTSSNSGQFITPTLTAANDACTTPYFVLCVQQ